MSAANENQRILDQLEAMGGSYVWEPEIFAVTVLGITVGDEAVSLLCRLSGVQQIAVNGEELSLGSLRRLASIQGLRSLVVQGSRVTSEELAAAISRGVEVQLI